MLNTHVHDYNNSSQNTNTDSLLVDPQHPLLLVVGQSLFPDIPLDQFCEQHKLSLHRVKTSSEALKKLNHHTVNLMLVATESGDISNSQFVAKIKSNFPLLPILLMSQANQLSEAVAAMKAGAVDCLVAPCSPTDVYNKLDAYLEKHSLNIDGMIAEDMRSRQLLQMSERVADSDVTVLISGKSGTGKEVLSRFIHTHSDRKKAPFIAVNCAAIPENMLESTLFGFEKGAFTGAHKSTAGKFELAQHGTLLLDEISEISLELQAKLLRVLQEREVERLGGNKIIDLDVRILATTNRNLMEEVAAGRFREDLYYRLNVFPLNVPELSDRPMDILPLAKQLVKRHLKPLEVFSGFGRGAEHGLLTHTWPGNVRELDNLMQRALILRNGTGIELEDLSFEPISSSTMSVTSDDPATDSHLSRAENLQASLRSVEEQKILDAIARGSRKQAAETLGISPRTLRYKLARMREAGISIPR